jgi:uncharacterized protein (TIGR02391 family)
MNKNTKKNVKKFSNDIQKYQEICRRIWGTDRFRRESEEFDLLKKEEENLRKELNYQWGKLENVFKKLGVGLIASKMGIQFLIFDEALGEKLFNNPIKGDSLEMAVQLSMKSLGKIESVNMEEFDFEDNIFHQRIKSGKCLKLFNDGHYSEAVENSFKIVRDRLRELTKHETGSDAFGKGKLYINGASAPHVDEDFQKGVQFLCMSLDRFRNEKSHFADGNIVDPSRAMHYLNLSNLLMNFLDEAKIKD